MELKYNQIVHILNGFSNQFLSGNLLERYKPLNIKITGIQIIDPNLEAFQLFPISNEYNSNIPKSDTINELAIARVGIGYSTALKMAEDETFFQYIISLHINEVLIAFEKNMGSLHDRIVKTERPGTSGLYFRDLENSAGFELRFALLKKE